MEWIQNHLINIGMTSGIFLVLGILLKKLPDILETKIKTALDALFTQGDAADDAFIVASIKWAEAKLGPGTGAAKANLVVDKIIAMLPIQYRLFVSEKSRKRAIELFQLSFDRIIETMHSEEIKNDAK